MKKLKITLPFLALLIAFSASALVKGSQKSKMDDPLYHWFAPNGDYLGQRSIVDQENLCPGSGKTCASGYTEVSEEETPEGMFITTVEKQ
jgi:hypothetical protein